MEKLLFMVRAYGKDILKEVSKLFVEYFLVLSCLSSLGPLNFSGKLGAFSLWFFFIYSNAI